MDDRGVGGSTGSTLASTLGERADDVRAMVRFLAGRPEIDAARIGLLGHSEGGWVVPIAAVLALFGERDLQVPPAENAEPLARILRADARPDRTVEVLPGLNHLFQPARTGLPAEYVTIETTIAPAVLARIGAWIVDIAGDRGD